VCAHPGRQLYPNRRLPACVLSKAVRVADCRHLATDWLPASSKQLVRMLLAEGHHATIPALPSLEETLSVWGCRRLTGTWLPADSMTRLVQRILTFSACQRGWPL
jgi:hypothetical protein